MKIGRWGLIAVLLSLGESPVAVAREPVVGGPCEGCEHVFVGRPEPLESRSRIAPASATGVPMVIEGTVRHPDGTPAPGIVVYAYQTDAGGIYPRGDTAHGALRGWAHSDANGRYGFDTIRPGAYPDSNIPQHVHMHVIEPGRVTYYIDDLVFDDDPLLTPAHRKRTATGRGGSGLGHPVRDARGVWRVQRDITLGQNVPGHAANGQ